MQENKNWYWKQQPIKQTIISPTSTIINPRLEVIIIRYVQVFPKKICSRTEFKKAMQIHPIIVTDADYDYIMDETKHSG